MRGALPLLLLAVSACAPLELGSDLLWTADGESGDLAQWLDGGRSVALTPSTPLVDDMPMTERPSAVEATDEAAHGGRFAIELVNPTGFEDDFEGPELLHDVGALPDAYYSAWYLLPKRLRISPHLTIMRLRSWAEDGAPQNGEELQLRSLASGDYALSVFHNNAGFLLEPVADPPPLVSAGRWFHVEARFEAQSGGRLRVWLDGVLYYDLAGRPGSASPELAFGVCNAAQKSDGDEPVVLYVDDAAVSLSRVGPRGKLRRD
jgi:hypothetical protein